MKRLTNIALGLALIASAATATTLHAQQARLAVGVRAGLPSGVSAKAFLNESIAFELNGAVRQYNGFNARNIGGAMFFYMSDHGMNKGFMRNVSLYGGAGLGRSYFTYEQSFIDGIKEQSGVDENGDPVTRKASYDDMSTNLRAYIGAQYLFQNAPIELSLDFGPDIHIGKVANAIGGHASLGVRYVILRQKGSVR